ncbi:peptide chain release factor N(5)-glutamine methyltransferase [Ramlibacter sp. 2FC]|uniref:peptide chain release factor N(5)-glutamine methyltransferase n=1 Tax=Ramlibacter sp. 2FC TaxID=2502188 RepID=UPI00201D8066|nr:peptide chain release factor N(5)-glutamine methyltransferase [Ramlibacter sp. 2FC]
MTLAQALAAAQALGLARLDAQLLLLLALERGPQERAWLLAHDTDPLPPERQQRFEQLLQRRAGGEPLAYLSGTKEFFGLPLRVDARVLDPRPDTETLVEWALELLAPLPGASVVDLGTGSGAIALALKHARPELRVTAVDASADALAVARANAERLDLPVTFLQGSWLSPVAGRHQLIVSNPPYVTDDDPHLAALAHEPLQALASGPDGLRDIREIIAQAPAHLLPGGWLLLEQGWDQAAAVRALLAGAGFVQVQSRMDLAGIARCSGGQWPGLG